MTMDFSGLEAIYLARYQRQIDALKDWLVFCATHTVPASAIQVGLNAIDEHRIYKIAEMKLFMEAD